MANPRVLKQQLCNILAHDSIHTWDFNDLTAENFAESQGVSNLIWSIYQKNTADTELENLLKIRFALHLRFRNALRQVLHVFEQNEVPVICIRGIALGPYYKEKLPLRPQSDIDLLFHPNTILQAKQILGNLGFKPSHNYPNVFVRGSIQLDLHTEPLGIERIKSWSHLTPLRADDFFNHATSRTLTGEKALITSTSIMLPYLCFHALKHSFERLIWMYDIALMTKHIEAEQTWDDLLKNILDFKLERPCYYALSYVKEHLNAPVPNNLLLAIRPKMGMVERKLHKRFMAHENIPYLAERLFSRMQPSFKHKIDFWRETIYPSYEVRAQIGGGTCVKCSFTRKRIKQLIIAAWAFTKEIFLVVRA